jgi:hypothetical protein
MCNHKNRKESHREITKILILKPVLLEILQENVISLLYAPHSESTKVM